MEIVISERIKSLEDFYVGKINNTALIDDEINIAGGLSDEAQGQRVTELMLKAAETLHVKQFILPLEMGGAPLPEIPSVEVYEAAYLKQKSVVMKGIQDTLSIRVKAEERTRLALLEADQWVENCKAQLEGLRVEQSNKEEMSEEMMIALDEAIGELDKSEAIQDQRYNRWSQEQTSLQKDRQAIEDWTSGAKKGASAQRDADRDALKQAQNALAHLKKHVAGLMAKVPSVSSVIMQMDEDGDPYDRSDMRACYSNLLSRYRKTEALEVATNVMIAIHDKQANTESLGVFSRRVQEFHHGMLKMGVTHISVSDLSAMIIIAGMKEASQKLFMESETQLALTMDNMTDTEDIELDAGGDSQSTTTKGGKKSLLAKTLRFVRKQEDQARITGKLTNPTQPRKPERNDAPTGRSEVQKKIREAQLAFATALRAADKNVCFEFAKNGVCSRGDQCQYKHIGSTTQDGRGTMGRGKGECHKWKETGECPFGNKCRFTHTPKADTGKVGSTGGAGAMQGIKPSGVQVAKPASRVLFAADRVVEEIDREEACVVMARAPAALACATREVDQREGKPVHILGWDTMCSLNVAETLDVIPGAVPLREEREAVGMGGVKPITHRGHSMIFNRVMSYIKEGGTPNLLSIGKECQRDKTGLEGMALFSANGAVRYRVNDELKRAFAALIDQAEAEGLVQGKAVLQNNVYKEAFGTNGPLEPDEVFAVEPEASAYAVSHNLYASRIRLDSVDNVLDFMVAAGLSEQALLDGIRNQSLRGLPPVVDESHVKQYFKRVGKSPEQLEAEIAKAPLRLPVDYEPERTTVPGHTMQIDNVDPSFSRMAAPPDASDLVSGVVPVVHKKVVPSVGGFKDAVLAVDEATGYAHLVGRVSKKDPHKILAQFMGKWRGRWGTLSIIKGDKEFITHESVALLNAYDVRFRQAVPGDHRRTSNMVEGSIRWILESAQGNMNRTRRAVKDKIITEHQARSLWFHALRQAVFAFNFRPSLVNPLKTRYEEGTGDVANLSNVVLMPFGMRLMGKNLLASSDGRGSECLYIGPSSTVRGGVLTYSVATERVSVKYAFLPITDVRRPAEPMMRKISKDLYGKMFDAPEGECTKTKAAVPGWEEVQGFGSSAAPVVQQSTEETGEVYPEPTVYTDSVPISTMPAVDEVPMSVPVNTTDACSQSPQQDSSDLGAHVESTKSGGGSKGKKNVVVSEYNTRRRAERKLNVELKMVEQVTRPPKPKVPPAKIADKCPRWIAAEEREALKLMEEQTTIPLPVDELGREMRPKDAIVLRLLKIREYKWKPDPETGVECWLECVRLVCDGSVDKRPEKYYAETPDRTLLLLMTSIEASLGMVATGSDVTRAYLNAESLDRNIVIVAPKGLRGFPRESLLNKGLYGSRAGALSWQVWIDDKMKDLEYRKLQVCRGVYMKTLPDGEQVRAYRHSDDFRMSCAQAEARVREEIMLRELVRMAEFTTLNRFLGCTFERVNAETGLSDPKGTIVLVRQVEKIREMQEKFSQLHAKFNPKDRVRMSALPTEAIKEEGDLDEMFGCLVPADEIEIYQAIVGCIQWIAGCTRPDVKLGAFLLSTRLVKPRVWDFYLAVYVMDYLVATIDAPLVLGGPIIDPIIYADASFAILPERRSVMGHVAFAGEGSGAIYAQVGSTKTAVTSIFEAELMAACGGIDTGVYLTSACKEMDYDVPECRKVKVDNKAEIDWVKGSVSNKRSRHIDVRYYRSRHLQEQGEVSVEYVPTEDNVADILTKPLAVKLFVKLARRILGHELVQGKGIKGVFEAALVD